MCRKNCKWDVGGGQSIHVGRQIVPLSQCSYVPGLLHDVVISYARNLNVINR